MATHSILKSTNDEPVTKSNFNLLIKAFKEHSGMALGYSLTVSKVQNIISTSLIASNTPKPLIIDSGASHHMISDTRLIKDIIPTLGNVVIANGDKIPIKGIGNLQLFEKNCKAFYMHDFTSNLLSVKRATFDLNCHVIFSLNDAKFQDIESNRVIGKGTTKDYNCACSFIPVLNKDALWHARLGHPHVRALNLIFSDVLFKNNDCEACILGKHCKSVFTRSNTIYDRTALILCIMMFGLLHVYRAKTRNTIYERTALILCILMFGLLH